MKTRGQTIDIAVGGRFHAEYMTQALLRAGFSVTLFTSYPKIKFPSLHPATIQSFFAPEILFRIGNIVRQSDLGDRMKMEKFGFAVSQSIAKKKNAPDLFISWSSFGLETLRLGLARRTVIMRDSSHIEYQSRILNEEYQRLGLRYTPRQFCIDRELEEYERADTVYVLSEFARQSFIENKMRPDKIRVLHLGVDTSLFKPLDIPSSLPLKVVYFGSISVRKGIHYLLDATKGLPQRQFKFTLIGSVEKPFRKLLKTYPHVEYFHHLPMNDLASLIRQMDIYVFPTLEDGFSNTLVQAMASGLLPISTPHCIAPEIIQNGINGYIVPSHNSMAIREHLLNLVENPFQIQKMRRAASTSVQKFSWDRYADSLVGYVQEALQNMSGYAQAR